jgi:hypothetical protein
MNYSDSLYLAMKSVHFPEVEAHNIPAPSPTPIHHHITIPFPRMNSEHLAYFSLAVPPREIRVHFWASSPGFPAETRLFCTHLLYKGPVDPSDTGGTLQHTPEFVNGGGPPSRVSCGHEASTFILQLNRYLWEELQTPVQGLVEFRVAVVAHVARMLEDASFSV